ncbi:NAD-dependent epimerase/dehydratase family protein [Endozoicomonas sp. ONNA2]|uniref:NAD-dependent epimerase/dehydratase family protein n=1 Tax=Endozoicomonas sp. ONNA2 TaxID=2828741 RepID=UPI00214753C8|nr:NAD-dependent epimerase/dehydratase family protein [Endozoicomonas sp. ONNA2]
MKTVFIVGHGGMVGSSIVRLLDRHSNVQIVTRSRSELDLTSQQAVAEFFQIDQVYLASIPLHEGLSMTYQWFLKNGAELRSV